MASPEQLSQLAFDFNRSSEESTVSYTITPGSLAELDHRDPGVGRFVRAVKEGSVIRSPTEAARYLIDRIYTPFDAFDQEELWVLLLNTRRQITHEALIYRGTIDTIHVRPAELFKAAVQVNAPALLLSHCHPSGAPRSA